MIAIPFWAKLLLLLLTVSGTIGGAWWWHSSKVSAAFTDGETKAQAACEKAKLEARAEALEDVITLDRVTDILDEAREREQDLELTAIARTARQALATYRESANALATAANDCRVPADRVQTVNESVGHGAAAPEG